MHDFGQTKFVQFKWKILRYPAFLLIMNGEVHWLLLFSVML